MAVGCHVVPGIIFYTWYMPNRVIFGEEVEGEKGCSGGREQHWMGCLGHDLSLLNLPTEAKHWSRTFAAK